MTSPFLIKYTKIAQIVVTHSAFNSAYYKYMNALFLSVLSISMGACFLTIITHEPEYSACFQVPLDVTLSSKPSAIFSEITIISLSLLVEVLVCQRPMPPFKTHIMKADPQLIMSSVCIQGQQWLYCPHVVYGGQVIASLSAVALGIRPGFGGFN